VILIKKPEETLNVSCGWTTLPLLKPTTLQRFSLGLNGGSPLQPIKIDPKAVKARR